MKHSKYDKVTNQTQVTLHCQFLKDRKRFIADNLNFTMNREQTAQLLKMLGVDELTSFTPMFIKIFRPEDDKKIEEWTKLVEPEDDGGKGKQDNLKDE